MATTSLVERMASDAAQAVELTEVYFCEALDFSESSLATVEQLVEEVHYSLPRGKTTENIDLLCGLWGAYLSDLGCSPWEWRGLASVFIVVSATCSGRVRRPLSERCLERA